VTERRLFDAHLFAHGDRTGTSAFKKTTENMNQMQDTVYVNRLNFGRKCCFHIDSGRTARHDNASSGVSHTGARFLRPFDFFF